MKAFFNGRIFNGEKFLKDACVLTSNNKIVEIVDQNKMPIDATRIDLQGNILAPALFDLQIYGGNGALFLKLKLIKFGTSKEMLTFDRSQISSNNSLNKTFSA